MSKKYLLYLPFLFSFFILSVSFSHAQGDVEIQATVDNTLPTINITNPNDGDTVSGIVNVTADAADDGGVAKVDFFIDGLLKQTDTTSPYTFPWDTGTVGNGSHTILARVTDIVGKTAEDSITVTVNNESLKDPSKPPTTVTGVPTKESKEDEEKEERKLLIFPGLEAIRLVEAPYDFVTANSNFFYGFLFALELLILYWIIKKLRERKKKDK